ncbi:para-aminobenzoate synthase, (PABA) [Savitreella phatthalungensis]
MPQRILLVDSYDSYSFNLYQLLHQVLDSPQVVVVRNDTPIDRQTAESSFDWILIGPGPGDPRNDDDVGWLRQIYTWDIPVLGVCLGFQLLCLAFGGSVRRLHTVKHGQIATLKFTGPSDLYDGQPFDVVRYHSIGATPDPENLEELAFVQDDCANGKVSMAARHRTRPYYAVQYHPESISSERGPDLIRRFGRIAEEYNAKCRHHLGCMTNGVRLPTDVDSLDVKPRPLVPTVTTTQGLLWREIPVSLDVVSVVEALCIRDSALILEAAAKPGRYSIIGLPSGKTIRYTASRQLHFLDERVREDVSVGAVWQKLAEWHANRLVHKSPVPFCGGLVGYFSYECGVASIGVEPLDSPCDLVQLSLVERSVVIDHQDGRIFVQSTCVTDTWVDETIRILSSAHPIDAHARATVANHANERTPISTVPGRARYCDQVRQAQDYLAEGQSYELCLTDQTRIQSDVDAWTLFTRLRARNPAPYAALLRFGDLALVSSSPERFLSFSSQSNVCQLRPIKGTIRRRPSLTLLDAERILRNPKDLAENLMIVDLIRHDLHQVASHVTCPKLMGVEAYETVYQLVSVIRGECDDGFTCVDLLKHSLPPGSMTGAPKKRSVQLLQQIESKPRGIYSGVCGYLSLDGNADWSVIIRSAFKYNSDTPWHIGAGGAVTALSHPDAEYDEMVTKLQSTLPAF